jgi:hypothetical protein
MAGQDFYACEPSRLVDDSPDYDIALNVGNPCHLGVHRRNFTDEVSLGGIRGNPDSYWLRPLRPVQTDGGHGRGNQNG